MWRRKTSICWTKYTMIILENMKNKQNQKCICANCMFWERFTIRAFLYVKLNLMKRKRKISIII